MGIPASLQSEFSLTPAGTKTPGQVLRTLQAAEIGGIRAILVHAISEDAKRFYERHGFSVSTVDPMTLMITVSDAKKALSGR
jgi:predicted Fe-Mo cluster-binding NifX family protein